MARDKEYYREVREANKKVWDGINELVSAQREFNALEYGTTLPNGSDLEGAGDAHNGVTAAELGAVVFDTANALVAVLNAGHAANMAKLLT